MQSQLDQFAKKAYPHILLLPVVEIIRLQSHLGVFLKISTDDQGHSNQPFVGIL